MVGGEYVEVVKGYNNLAILTVSVLNYMSKPYIHYRIHPLPSQIKENVFVTPCHI